jgi:hypothetical protein
MKRTDDVAALKAEVKALKVEVAGLREFIQAMYQMMNDEDDYDDPPGGSGFGRYNT